MHNIWSSITNTFNNREISFMIWLLFVFGIVIYKERLGFLNGLWEFIKNFFSKVVLTIQATFWAYLIGVVFLLKFLGLWNTSMIKDTLIFLLITALVLVMKIATSRNRKQSLKEVFTDAIKPIVFAEFIMNLKSFSLFGELILLPFILVFYLGAYTNRNKPGQEYIAKGYNILLVALSLYTLYHGINYLYTSFNIIDKQQTIRDFLFPVLTTLAFLPYLYGAIQYMKWEEKRIQKRIKGMN